MLEQEKGLVVVSLCDGMSCGQIALKELGIKVEKYYASEIKEIGIKVTKDNFPNTIHIGDLTKIKYKDGKLITEVGIFEEKIDLVMFGSPCQTFSIACKADKRIGMEDEKKSGLFLHCHRILEEIKPRYFFMENVASMNKEDKEFITELMGVEPIRINAKNVAAASRDRYYWTNIKQTGKTENCDIKLNDILENGWSDSTKARALLVSDSRPLTTTVKMFHRYYATGFTTLIFKSKEHYDKCVAHYNENYKGKAAKEIPIIENSVYEGVRYLTQRELEKCQEVPKGYTKVLTRNEAADVLGDGWNIKVIKQLFKGLHNKGDK